MTALVVLWLYFAQPWSWGPIPMTPGWASVAVLDPEACAEALTRTIQPAVCASPGVELEPLAQTRRE